MTRRRSNLTIRMTYGEGSTWPVSKVIESGNAAYSDITVTSDGKIHCLYEESNSNKQSITLASFSLEWLTDGKEKLNMSDKPLNKK